MNDGGSISFDGSRIVRLLLGVLLTLVIVWFFARGLERSDMMMLLMPPFLFAFVLLLNYPAITCILFVGLFNAMVTLPGLPTGIDLSRLLVLLFVVTALAQSMVRQSLPIEKSLIQALVVMYAVLLLVHVKVRGFGLRLFGGDAWGGMQVVAQFIIIALFIFRTKIVLTVKQWFWAFVLSCILPAIPMVADILFFLSGGAVSAQYAVVKVVTSALASGYATTRGGVWRLQRAAGLGTGLVRLAFALLAMQRIRRMRFVAYLFGALVFVGVSGHRLAVANVVVFAVVFLLLRYPRYRARMLTFIVIFGLGAYLTLLLTARYLPGPYQRSLSFVPGIRVSTVAAYDAAGTTEWRINLWRLALVDVKRYFWIGKGLNIDPEDIHFAATLTTYARAAGHRWNPYLRHILLRDYHNGPLALLLDLGVGGLVLGVLFTVTLIREGVRTHSRRAWNSHELRMLYLIMLARVTTHVVIFFVLYGDVRTMMVFLFLGALMEGIAQSDRALGVSRLAEAESGPAAVPAGAAGQ